MEDLENYSNQKLIDFVAKLKIKHTSKKDEMLSLLDKYDILSDELVEIEKDVIEANKMLKTRIG